jgi:hypothetical protein
MAISLDIYRRVDAPSALGPVANDLVAVEKRQDNRVREQSSSLLLFSKHIVIPQCCVNTGASRLCEHQKSAQSYWDFGG